MENYCANCIMYLYDQNLLQPGECLICHDPKSNIQFLDETKYGIYYVPMKYGITEIKKILHHVADNAYKIKKDTEEGNLIVAGRLYEVVPVMKWLMEEDILFQVTPVNPLERYDYWKKCRYGYCAFRKLVGK